MALEERFNDFEKKISIGGLKENLSFSQKVVQELGNATDVNNKGDELLSAGANGDHLNEKRESVEGKPETVQSVVEKQFASYRDEEERHPNLSYIRNIYFAPNNVIENLRSKC